ncbi:hypothetical protein J4407_02010 [Candidatus Pacearchaeota archaeon]|nr:hypothetical protein [Candidatus Pacearchaeota archaeon]
MKKIGIDIDGVLAENMGPLMDFHNHNYGTNLTVENVFCFNLEKIWKVDREEVVHRLLDYYDSMFFDDVSPIEDSVDAVRLLAKENKFVAITGRPDLIRTKTTSWLEKFFPGYFSEVHFSNYVSKHGYGFGTNKSDLCLKNECEILIDDHMDFALDCASRGIKVFLLNKPWNNSYNGHQNISRINNLKEVRQYLV